MDIDLITQILFATIKTGTPLLFIALGEVICEKSGVLNLGQEGMMLMGAVVGFMCALATGNLGFAIFASMAMGAAMSLIFGFLVLHLGANQVATGLALTIFGTGLSAFIGSGVVGQTLQGFQPIIIPVLSDIPVIGKILFTHDLLVYLSFIIAAVLAFVANKTRLGLTLRAVGENPHAANAIGIKVLRVRYLAIMFGGAMAGLAGAYMSLSYTPMWVENMTSGRGWIALALVVFASWRIGNIMLGAYLFGLASIMHLVLQGMGWTISPNLLAMLPYIATVVVMVIISADQFKEKLLAPRSLGKPFDPRQMA
ncbi:ABC transporter permease [Marinomonas mediterranea]|jgi:nucleoside ABC transporter membrane protein|uniref:ABC-type transporter, integral membrane subunit n=1 Tax=Marinomonas mediterranea (strain ATCC 700492 / JCM 21426 / NBRC 103028 / MMB-1) TaxID=717774 RepID=F2K0M4_MARM1|nr:ABC transporter permease [Marinomonas mediterranea]ADZ91008.1 ABC-type transporter, integral membrane subunit [Marinomonas mediterranea MMB-1]WCN09045.1 ABC transporter permease [Marinomonas mediterranea]WCN13077.1 ABC transporter permease [Marinomonas mediterranea]WCN17147.1 ABC transporter permease [Marinomonas mediterranea MMB-1]